jgi:CubicO group peptidase (beta-lactamase class C family)
VIFESLERSRHRLGAPAIGAALVPATGAPTVVVTGERVRGGGVPVLTTDRWHIGSCMKVMTATLVARFVERGRLDWSTPLAELFDGADPAWRGRSVAEVLTHTAGVPANPTPAEMRTALADPTPLPEQRARIAAQTLARAPGQPGRFRYSNLGYVLVGAALERLTGEPFEAILGAEVLAPLGITSAGFGPPGPDQPWGHRARWLAFGRGPAVDPADRSLTQPPDNPPLLSPAGRLHLTLHDWAAFVRTFLAGADEATGLISAASRERLITERMGWWVPSGGRLAQTIAFGQQGSNTRWTACAVVAADRSTAALVVCNDGRTRLLTSTLRLGVDLLPLALAGQRE